MRHILIKHEDSITKELLKKGVLCSVVMQAHRGSNAARKIFELGRSSWLITNPL